MDVSTDRRNQVRDYYLQEEVVEEMVRTAQYREFAPTYPTGYGSRPDAINFPGDFKRFVENGAIAFHGSVERWRNPLLIGDVDSDNLRTGWDLVIDIDCDHDLTYAKITAARLLNELHSFGINHISAKFSGNRGFHLGIRHEAFPKKVQGKPVEQWYPDLPQVIVSFLRHRLKDELTERFIAHDNSIRDTIYEDGEPRPYTLCDIENDWGDRHLFRMPYAVNEKSWLVSLPIEPTEDAIMAFEKPDAAIDAVNVEHQFLDTYEDGEATKLVVEALDWHAEHAPKQKERTSFDGEYSIPDNALPEDYFPPTIHNILSGLKDGRKRSLFILITFLQQTGYDWDAIQGMIHEWNQRNEKPLSDRYINAQLDWHQRQNEPLMPPNWEPGSLYHDLGVYEEDKLTKNTSNPVSYAFAKASDNKEDDGKNSGKKRKKKKDPVECPYCGKQYENEGRWYKKHVQECFG